MPVLISGVRNTLDALSMVSVKAAQNVEKEIHQATAPIVSKARGYAPAAAPLSGWGKHVGLWANRAYNAFEVRSGIGFSDEPTQKNRQGFSYTAYIYNKSAAGAIYETAGRKNPNGRKQAPRVKHYTDAGTPSARFEGRYIRSGTKNQSKSENPNAGKQFIQSMGMLYKVQRVKGQKGRTGRKKNGRLIFRAWGEDQGKVLGAVAKAYDNVIQDFNAGTITK